MDMSKLPKFSQTPAPSPPSSTVDPETAVPVESQAPRKGANEYVATTPERGSPGEIWFNVIVGVIFLLLGRSFGAYMMAKLMHQPYHTGATWQVGPKEGQEVAYPDLEGNVFWTDSAVFLFGLAVITDALIRVIIFSNFRYKRPLVYVAFAIAAAATAYNLYVAGLLLKGNVLPLLSLLAVAFGGYITYQQWILVKLVNRGAKA